MKMNRRNFLWIVTFAILCIKGLWIIECQASDPQQPILGFVECSPALFRPLPSNEVVITITDITHDPYGRVTGFKEEFNINAATVKTKSSVSAMSDCYCCDNKKYAVTVADRKLVSATKKEFMTSTLDGFFAFVADNIGGIVIIGKLDGGLKTSFSYDKYDRRQLSSQSFTWGSRHYHVTYSAIKFGKNRWLYDYKATLTPLKTIEKQETN